MPSTTARLRERDISAYGGKAKLNYLFRDRWNNQLSLNAEYLSGDDPDTDDKDEMLRPPLGPLAAVERALHLSLRVRNQRQDRQMNNLIRFGPAWSCNPMKGMSLSAAYNALFAPQDRPLAALGSRRRIVQLRRHFSADTTSRPSSSIGSTSTGTLISGRSSSGKAITTHSAT